MDTVKIDAHVHLWNKIHGRINGKPVRPLTDGLVDFGGEIRQMMPPYLTDGKNTVDRLMANMNYARVNAAVITQEYIDGNQDRYLLKARAQFPDRIKVTALYEDYWNTCMPLDNPEHFDQFDGLKICSCRLRDQDLKKLLPVFKAVEKAGKFISIDMADGDRQTADLQFIAESCPDLRIAIGHFGMVTTKGWQKQIELARNPNVYIESGGLTWLFHKEFYPYESAIDAVLEARNICGMNKLMWGSDYPRTMTDITYSMAVRFIEETTKLTDSEKQAFLGENAVRFYGFKDLQPLPPIVNML